MGPGLADKQVGPIYLRSIMAVERETGSETRACPTCDRPLAVQTNADGSKSPVRCEHCYPVDIVETAAAEEVVPREQGTDVVDEGNPDDRDA